VPAFTFEGHTYHNPVELALFVIGGKWKMPIPWRLNRRTWRYNELRRELSGISHKMLTQQLRELEQHGLITRTVHAVVPPRVDYDLTARERVPPEVGDETANDVLRSAVVTAVEHRGPDTRRRMRVVRQVLVTVDRERLDDVGRRDLRTSAATLLRNHKRSTRVPRAR
jgi:DNA-binding HxlR family transcriptional regulator